MTAHHAAPIQEPWRPGSWVQARLVRFDKTLVTLLLAGIALVRAWDYATPPWWAGRPSPSLGLAVVERAAPLWLWVVLLTVGGLTLAVSAVLRVHIGVFLGHAVLTVVYMALGAGLLGEYLTHPWLDGIRSAGPVLLIASIHLLLTLRTGWRPIR